MIEILTYDFMVHALITSVLGAVTAGIIGTYVVTRRIVFITGGITHASFGGLGIAYFVGMNPLIGAGIFSVLSGWSIEAFSQRRRVREDSLIAMTWSFGMAIGIIFIFITPGYTPNLMSYLFGNILTVSLGDMLAMGILMLAVILVFVVFFRRIQFITFDEEYARASGIRVTVFKYLLITLVALTSVIYIRVAGIILVLSMLTIPQNTAMILTHRMRGIILLSIAFSLAGSLAGLLISYFGNIPSGASIIFSLTLIYLLTASIKPLVRRIVKS